MTERTTDNRPVSDRNRGSKIVVGSAVGGCELRSLPGIRPPTGRHNKQVGCALLGVRTDLVPVGARHYRGAVDRHTIRAFHLDSLCAQVPLAVDFDVALTILADLIYRHFAHGLHAAYRNQTPDTLRAQLIDGIGELRFTPGHIEVALRRRTHTPALLDASYQDKRIEVPWWGARTLSYSFPAR
jgi:hypothetical protein